MDYYTFLAVNVEKQAFRVAKALERDGRTAARFTVRDIDEAIKITVNTLVDSGKWPTVYQAFLKMSKKCEATARGDLASTSKAGKLIIETVRRALATV